MKKTVVVGAWNGSTGRFFEKEHLYHGITREEAIICYIEQAFNDNYNTCDYPKSIEGIYKSNMVRDRLLFDLDEDTVLFAQYA